ncbi:MAG: GPR endopeptidase [Eubacteriales bacterium]|nr:GPR endopeptidase [Eubacteriales bacterium]
MEPFKIRTDLAVEINEEASKETGKIKGIIVNEHRENESGILVTEIKITNREGERVLGREKGTYITIEADCISFDNAQYQLKAAKILTGFMKQLIEGLVSDKQIRILVVGLGNREVTSDSLGPLVVDHLEISQENPDNEKFHICAVSPGVLAQTGMETANIIKGIVKETRPDIVIAIDALAARNSRRLNSTIQLSDRGITPGSGVGNHRTGLTKTVIGVPVLAIGVPTVIDAPTIVSDSMENLITAVSSSERLMYMSDLFEGFTRQEKYHLIKEVMPSDMADMYVTPKNIDANVCNIAFVLAHAINALNDKKEAES